MNGLKAHPNEQLINDFYTAFARLDWQAMSDCYHPEIEFSDPVFEGLQAVDTVHMWHMLCDSAEQFELSHDKVQADDTHGSACWQATYVYPATGRKVKNLIFAEFQFKNGKICRHTDHFSFWRWSRMALGPLGLLLGWSGRFRHKVQQRAMLALRRFKRGL